MKYFSGIGPVSKLVMILSLFLCFAITYSCNPSEKPDPLTDDPYIPQSHRFVGNQTCQSCHSKEWEEWRSSHHHYAMSAADEDAVKGDFNDAGFSDLGEHFFFYREGESFMVKITDPEGDTETHRIDYTFGLEPLQQYLIDIGQGKYQALQIAWDTEKRQWFSLFPDEQFADDDWMHWRGGAMNWNTMCADCHSTNLEQNYVAEADSFSTNWSEINVSCEACHGPGGDHVEFVESPEGKNASRERISEDLDLGRSASQINEINTCAPCHSIRQKLTDEYLHGDNYLDHFVPQLPHPDLYYADGQIREEVFVFGSFLQSKMYARGVQCSDCHNPHSLQLRQPLTNNQLCMSCHELQYNTPGHHFHKMNTEASQCINCHMTGRVYMGNDYRRDHSFRVPRPDQSKEFNTPNACNDCHSERSAEWASDAIIKWYGVERDQHYSDVFLRVNEQERESITSLKQLIEDTTQAEIIRATAVWYAGRFPEDDSYDILANTVKSESPMVRASAVKAMDNLPLNMRQPLLSETINDTVRAVRLPAARMLAGLREGELMLPERESFKNALQEYKEYLDINEYFPQGQMNRGQFYERRGEIDKALEAYKIVLEKDSRFNPARLSLAYLYNRLGENKKAEELLRIVIDQEPASGEAYYSLGLLLAEQQQFGEATDYFEQAARLMPDYGRLFYNWAVALQTLKKYEDAEQVYMRAIELEPENSDFIYGVITLYMQQKEYEKAYKYGKELKSLNENDSNVDQLLYMIKNRMSE